jgi:putative ABC transport system ATP-binding protein
MQNTNYDFVYFGRGVSYSYGQPSHQNNLVLDHMDFEIRQNEVICLSGPSGSGKSTLLSLMALIESPQLGSLTYRGQDVKKLSEEALSTIRRNEIGFIFQDFQLIEVLTVAENVEYFITRQKVPAKERKTRVKDALESVGLSSFGDRRVTDLSGGQRQRVAIARALAKNPGVIIADEPTASLDVATSRQIMETLQKLNEQRNITILIASHDLMVLEFATRILHIQDGRIDRNQKVDHRAS